MLNQQVPSQSGLVNGFCYRPRDNSTPSKYANLEKGNSVSWKLLFGLEPLWRTWITMIQGIQVHIKSAVSHFSSSIADNLWVWYFTDFFVLSSPNAISRKILSHLFPYNLSVFLQIDVITWKATTKKILMQITRSYRLAGKKSIGRFESMTFRTWNVQVISSK